MEDIPLAVPSINVLGDLSPAAGVLKRGKWNDTKEKSDTPITSTTQHLETLRDA